MSKILNEVPEEHREDTVNSLSYEAEARLQDPVYGCIGAIAYLQRRMFQLEHDLALARARLAQYKARSLNTNATATSITDNGVFGLGGQNFSIIHMNLCNEGLTSSDQFSQSDGGGCISTDFGQVHDLLPL